MSKYPGLVIGGPLDGQLVENESSSFEVIVRRAPFDDVTSPDTHVKYSYHATAEGIHFWFADGETPSSVLTKLSLAYMKEAQQRNGF